MKVQGARCGIRLCCCGRRRPAVNCNDSDKGPQPRPPPLLPGPAELGYQGPEALQGGRRRHQPPARQLRRECQAQRRLLLGHQALLPMQGTNASAHALVYVPPNLTPKCCLGLAVSAAHGLAQSVG